MEGMTDEEERRREGEEVHVECVGKRSMECRGQWQGSRAAVNATLEGRASAGTVTRNRGGRGGGDAWKSSMRRRSSLKQLLLSQLSSGHEVEGEARMVLMSRGEAREE